MLFPTSKIWIAKMLFPTSRKMFQLLLLGHAHFLRKKLCRDTNKGKSNICVKKILFKILTNFFKIVIEKCCKKCEFELRKSHSRPLLNCENVIPDLFANCENVIPDLSNCENVIPDLEWGVRGARFQQSILIASHSETKIPNPNFR